MARAYGTGSMRERAPGVWRLRYMRNGRQIEETFRGTTSTSFIEGRRLVRSEALTVAPRIAAANPHLVA